jgi:7,8-dihydropterin-6-yl-methyl-4-(beta-D-ribofuranosyl)aminobenzene 5'-phosphate synthase
MTDTICRRDLLKASAALAGLSAAGTFGGIDVAAAGPIEPPAVDSLAIRVLIDSSQDNFFRPNQVHGVSIQPPPRPSDFRQTLHNQWGLSLYLQSKRGDEQRTLMLDYGYSADALLNNIDIVKADPIQARSPRLSSAMVISTITAGSSASWIGSAIGCREM